MGARLAPTGLRCPGKCRQPSDVGAAGDHSLEEAGPRAPRSISCLLVYCRWLHQAASFTRTDLSSFLVLRPRPGSREDSVHDVRCCWSTDGRHAHLRTVAGSAAVHRRRAHGSLDVQRKRLRESVRRRGNALRNETHNGQVAVSESRPVLLRHPGTPPPPPAEVLSWALPSPVAACRPLLLPKGDQGFPCSTPRPAGPRGFTGVSLSTWLRRFSQQQSLPVKSYRGPPGAD